MAAEGVVGTLLPHQRHAPADQSLEHRAELLAAWGEAKEGGGDRLLQAFDWRSIFIAMTPIAAAAGLLVAGYVPMSRDPHAPRTDRAGFALSTAMISLVAISFFAISFFALSGFIFLVTQYFQFLKGYGPLSTGVRLLPVATSVAISSILGTRLAVRIGTKVVVAFGLVSMAAFYLWVATTTTATGYGTIAAQMVAAGTGLGLTSAPATEAIMGVVPKAKAGVGSAVNDATRLLGGTQ